MDTLSRDNFILRIYRRDEEAPDNLVGQIEFVKTGEKLPFKGIGELFKLLTDTKNESNNSAKTGVKRRKQ